MRAHSESDLDGRSCESVLRKESSSVAFSAGISVSAMERKVSSCAGVKVRGVAGGGIVVGGGDV